MIKIILIAVAITLSFQARADDKAEECDTSVNGDKITITGATADTIFDRISGKETASAEGEYIKPHFYKKSPGLSCEKAMGGGDTICILSVKASEIAVPEKKNNDSGNLRGSDTSCSSFLEGNKITITGAPAAKLYSSLKGKETGSSQGNYIKPHFYKKVKNLSCDQPTGGSQTSCEFTINQNEFTQPSQNKTQSSKGSR